MHTNGGVVRSPLGSELLEPDESPGNRLQLRLFELYIIAYLSLVSILVVVFGHVLEHPLRVIGVHTLLTAIIIGVNLLPHPDRGWTAAVKDWYALPVIIWIFGELGSLNQMVHEEYFDAWVIGWEQTLFGSQPALWLADYFDSPLLMELASIGFLSYFAVFPGLGLRLYRRPDRSGFFAFVASVTFAFLVSYLFYLVFPVNGPSYLFAEADPALLDGGVFTALSVAVHDLGMPSAAFPSAHVGVTIVALLSAWRLRELAAFGLLLVSLVSLTFGVVYSGYHFAVDAVAGVITGAGLYVLGRVAEAKLGGWSLVRPEGDPRVRPERETRRSRRRIQAQRPSPALTR